MLESLLMASKIRAPVTAHLNASATIWRTTSHPGYLTQKSVHRRHRNKMCHFWNSSHSLVADYRTLSSVPDISDTLLPLGSLSWKLLATLLLAHLYAQLLLEMTAASFSMVLRPTVDPF